MRIFEDYNRLLTLEAAKAEPGEFTKEIRRVYGLSSTRVDKIKPTHGPCCTCQRCGYDHDECKCLDNDFIELCDRLDAKDEQIEKREHDAAILCGEIARLTAENQRLREICQNNSLFDNDALREQNQKLTAENKAQAARIAELERIAKLELEAVTQLSRNAGVSESAIQAHISTFEQALKGEQEG